MYTKLMVRCMDVNSEYCPCLLADTNHCLHCSHLQGKPLCDCEWVGKCVYYEKLWQGSNRGRGQDDMPIRMEVAGLVRQKKQLSDELYEVLIEVTPELAGELQHSGTFVFIRNSQDPQYCDFPVAVLEVKDNQIRLMIEAVGAKTVRCLECNPSTIMVRGPYYNGILGQPWIDHTNCGKIIIIAGGLGQVAALPAARELCARGNEVTALLAPGSAGVVFIDEELQAIGADVHILPSLRRDGLPLLSSLLTDMTRTIDLVFSSGPDEQHYSVIAAMREADVDLPLAVTNNVRMCCGEGLCGSCEKTTIDNRRLKLCKAQSDFLRFVREDTM